MWGAIGVTVNLTPSSSAAIDFIVRHAAPVGVVNGTAPGAFGPLSIFVPGTAGDVCSYNDPTITSSYEAAQALNPLSKQGIASMKGIQKLIFQQALNVFVVTTAGVLAWDANVHNLGVNPYYYSVVPVIDYWSGVSVSN